jgi:single-strand DNA-binding protein
VQHDNDAGKGAPAGSRAVRCAWFWRTVRARIQAIGPRLLASTGGPIETNERDIAVANYNKVILLGNLTRDIELRNTQGGTALAKFGMAINRKWTQNGEQKESTCFVDLTAWGRQAEVLNQYVKKGSQLFVEGRLEFSTWEAEGGGKRSKLEVVVENFQFVGSGRAAGGGAGGGDEGGGERRSGGRRPQAAEGQAENVDYGDIPF